MSDEKEQGRELGAKAQTIKHLERWLADLKGDSQPDSERVAELHKWPLCVHGKHVVDCVACHIMVRNAIRPWRQKCSTLEAELADARKELSKHQSSEFHPDLSLLKATQDSNAELHATIREQAAELEGEVERLRDELCAVVDEAVQDGGIDEQTPNAVGQPVSTEPTPSDMVGNAIRNLRKERDEQRDTRICDDFMNGIIMDVVDKARRVREMFEAKLPNELLCAHDELADALDMMDGEMPELTKEQAK